MPRTTSSTILKQISYFLKVKSLLNQSKLDSNWYIHDDIGYNYRLNNINAAIGYAQLKRMKKIIDKRKKINNLYKKHFREIGDNFSILENPSYSESNYWLTVVIIKNVKKYNFINFVNKTIKSGVNIRPLWKLNHLHPHTNHFERYNINSAKAFQYKAICLPSSYSLTGKDIKYITGFFKCLN